MVQRLSAMFLLAFLAAPVFASAAAPETLQERSFVTVNPPQPVEPFLFEDDKERTLDLKQFKGRYVLLNLWATTCTPCIAEMPALNELSAKLDSKKIAIIALAEDHDGQPAVKTFYQRHKIDRLKIYSDPTGRAPFLLDSRGLPTSLLIDPEGKEIGRLEGAANWTHETMLAYLKARISP